MTNRKRLYRSTTDRQVAGVCGGLADYFGVDVTLIRLGFILLTLLGGPGLLIYVVMWLVMPEADTSEYVWDDSEDVVEMPNIQTVKDEDFTDF